MMGDKITFMHTYLRARELGPNPRVRHDLSHSDIQQLVSEHGNDPEVKAAFAKTHPAPTKEELGRAQAITASKVKEIYAFKLGELKNVLSEFDKLPNKNHFDTMIVPSGARAIVDTKIRKNFGITFNDVEHAMQINSAGLQGDRAFMKLFQ